MSNNKPKIIITGATGFIGKNFVSQTANEFDFFHLTREIQDLSRPLKLKPLKTDIILHLAQANSYEPRDLFDINIQSTFNLLEYGKQNKIKKFIYASAGNVYGFGSQKFKESERLNPSNLYGASKAAAEEICWRYRDYFSVNILRFFAPFGPDQQEIRLIPSLIKKIKNNEPVIINNAAGNPRISPIYINDVIEVIKRVAQIKESCRMNIGGGHSYSILEISELIGEIIGRKPIYKIVKNPDIGDVAADISFMRRKLGFSPKISIKKGLKLCAV